MYIELTDVLRCPAEHAESYLVLIPHAMEGRRVVRGMLGCPACQAEYQITAGVALLGEPPAWFGEDGTASSSAVEADGVLALLGLEGPGGFVALAGSAGRLGAELAELLPGVHWVAINQPAGLDPRTNVSLVRAARWPLKSRVRRGVVVAGAAAGDTQWRDRATCSSRSPPWRASVRTSSRWRSRASSRIISSTAASSARPTTACVTQAGSVTFRA